MMLQLRNIFVGLLLSTALSHSAPVAPSPQQFFGTDYDVIIIGGGPAGLQAAMSCARLQRTAIVLDSAEYRNNATLEMHDVPALDGTPPAVFRATARAQIAEYDAVTFQPAYVTSIQNINNGTKFIATDSEGNSYSGRKLIMATGIIDNLPDYPGLSTIWGTGAFWCLFCDGWEHREGHVAFLSMATLDDALAARNLYEQNMTVLLNGTTPEANVQVAEEHAFPGILNSVENDGIMFESRVIQSFGFVDPSDRLSEVVVTYADASTEIYEGILIPTRKTLRGSLFAQLGLALDPANAQQIKTVPRYSQTSVFGVYAAGDMSSASKNVPNALFQAKGAAVTCVLALGYEDAEITAGNYDSWRSVWHY